MLLEGNQRGGAKNLALHLMKDDNDHVRVHQLRGFVSNDLVGALNEAYALSRATKCKQFLYSLSLNPPEGEPVTSKLFEDAADRVEQKLGLTGQPRAIVFHEKKGRPHAHAVWSRIDIDQMKAIQLSHTKLKLKDVSRELFLKHGWTMPDGFADKRLCNPHRFTMAQWQQARRAKKDPRVIQTAFEDAWATSECLNSFAAALKERGYVLARGDRRGFVAVDHRCEVFAIAKKWIGVNAKAVREKLGKGDSLPTVSDAKTQMANEMAAKLYQLLRSGQTAIDLRLSALVQSQASMIARHRQKRAQLNNRLEARAAEEVLKRQQRFSRGLRGVWDWLSGQRRKIARQNELDSVLCDQRDMQERDQLSHQQLQERLPLRRRIKRLEAYSQVRSHEMENDANQYHEISRGVRDVFERQARRGPSLGL